MNKILLLTAASIIAPNAGGVFATDLSTVSVLGQASPFQVPNGAKVLWNQNSDYAGDRIDSENFTGSTSSSFNDQGADDFVIPKGQTWKITEVDVTGAYFNGSGPATYENIIFYQNRSGMPGSAVKNGNFNNLHGRGSGGDFAFRLPGKGLKLGAGHYWVSVIADMDFVSQGEWGWEVSSAQHQKQAMWQNSGRGFGICPTWGTIADCQSSPGPDLMFDLQGKVELR